MCYSVGYNDVLEQQNQKCLILAKKTNRKKCFLLDGQTKRYSEENMNDWKIEAYHLYFASGKAPTKLKNMIYAGCNFELLKYIG